MLAATLHSLSGRHLALGYWRNSHYPASFTPARRIGHRGKPEETALV